MAGRTPARLVAAVTTRAFLRVRIPASSWMEALASAREPARAIFQSRWPVASRLAVRTTSPTRVPPKVGRTPAKLAVALAPVRAPVPFRSRWIADSRPAARTTCSTPAISLAGRTPDRLAAAATTQAFRRGRVPALPWTEARASARALVQGMPRSPSLVASRLAARTSPRTRAAQRVGLGPARPAVVRATRESRRGRMPTTPDTKGGATRTRAEGTTHATVPGETGSP